MLSLCQYLFGMHREIVKYSKKHKPNKQKKETKMSTQIFLGPPPPHVEAWMKANWKAPDKWVPAVYTDEWLFSDGDSTHNVEYSTAMEDMWTIDGALPRSKGFGKNCTVIEGTTLNTDLSAYRVFTPGHWEDANGNWINGSWDNETKMAAIYDPFNYKCEWQEKGLDIGDGLIIQQSGWYAKKTEYCSNTKNENIISYINLDALVYAWHRTWINTVPEP